MLSGRAILHIDMDAFFASVEQLDAPELGGQPVLVGHDGPRGVVAAASYESRAFGCRSALPISVAKRLCPQAIIVPVRFWRYRQMSGRIFSFFEEVTDLIGPLSIDEAFLDVTGSQRLLGPAEQIAVALKKRIRQETGLTASIGVAPNKFLAKLASDLEKPDGLTIIRDDNVDQILPKLPVSKIWGIGPKTAKRLDGLNIRTIGDLRRMPEDWFAERFGTDGERYLNLAFGRDNRPVCRDRDARSISQEQTFEIDVPEAESLRQVLLSQVEQVAGRLRKHQLRARAVTVKIRYGEFQTITRSVTLDAPADGTQPLWEATRGLFDEWARAGFQPVRLIGMGAKNITSDLAQMELFPDVSRQRNRRLDDAVDRINQKLGEGKIHRGAGGS